MAGSSFVFALVVADQTNVQTSDLYLPFYIIIGVFLLLGIISLMAPLPEVKAAGETNRIPPIARMQQIKLLFGNFPTWFWVH